MKSIKILSLVIGVMVSTMLISINSIADMAETTVVGILKKRGTTTYQYGTHILVDKNKTLYAFKSSTITLNKYIGKQVKIHGSLIQGYPVDGGPVYLDVKRVDLFKKISAKPEDLTKGGFPPDPGLPYCVDCGTGYHCVHSSLGDYCAPDPKPKPPLDN